MPGYSSISDLVTECETNGKLGEINFYKSSTNIGNTIAGSALELFQGTGQPGAISFSGVAGTATQLNSSTSGALPINGNVSTDLRYLLDLQIKASGGNGISIMLVDLLLYYPNISINTVPTVLINVATLPRYTNGIGVQAIITTTTALTTSAPALTLTYTDSVNNSTTGVLTAISSTSVASQLFSSSAGAGGPFLPMGSTGQGVKSVASYTIASGTATGAATIILIKPLMTISLGASNALTPSQEKDMIFQFPSLPQIQDGACLGLMIVESSLLNSGTILQGRLRYGWG